MLIRSMLLPILVKACYRKTPIQVINKARVFSMQTKLHSQDFSLWNIKNNEYYNSKQFGKALRLKNKRLMRVISNKMSQTWPPCYYCGSSGFVDCDNCTHGCWECQHTKMLECPFCNGSGKGRYARQEATVRK